MRRARARWGAEREPRAGKARRAEPAGRRTALRSCRKRGALPRVPAQLPRYSDLIALQVAGSTASVGVLPLLPGFETRLKFPGSG